MAVENGYTTTQEETGDTQKQFGIHPNSRDVLKAVRYEYIQGKDDFQVLSFGVCIRMKTHWPYGFKVQTYFTKPHLMLAICQVLVIFELMDKIMSAVAQYSKIGDLRVTHQNYRFIVKAREQNVTCFSEPA